MRAPLTLIPGVLFLLFACQGNKGGAGTGPVAAGDSAQAGLLELEQRIINSPRDPERYADRARWYEGHGRIADAVEDWKRAILLDSTNTDYRIALGDAHYHDLKIDLANAAYDRALELDPKSDPARLKVAEMQMLLRHYKDALDKVNEALHNDPNQAQAYFLKGWIYMETGDTARAISSLRTCVEQDPSNYRAFMQLGLLHARRRDPLALQYFNTALELDPASAEAWYAKGYFEQENGDDGLALACYDSIKYIDPRDPRPWFNSGYIRLEHLDDPEQAVHDFTAAAKLAPKDPRAWYNRGLAYERKGSLDSAAMDYRKALEVMPTYDEAAIGLQRLEDRGVKVPR